MNFELFKDQTREDNSYFKAGEMYDVFKVFVRLGIIFFI